jgi:hypothetical protein
VNSFVKRISVYFVARLLLTCPIPVLCGFVGLYWRAKKRTQNTQSTLDVLRSAYMMGIGGGAIWHFGKGWKNTPYVRFVLCDSYSNVCLLVSFSVSRDSAPCHRQIEGNSMYKVQGALRAVQKRAPIVAGMLVRVMSCSLSERFSRTLRDGLVFVTGSFAAWGTLFTGFECGFTAYRGREDYKNGIAAGFCVGGILNLRRELLKSCWTWFLSFFFFFFFCLFVCFTSGT